MIAIPARVSPPRSLPPSPVVSAAPAVVIRQAAEPVAATPAVTLHSAAAPAAPHSPPRGHTHSHASPYAAFYPSTAVVATPAAVFHEPHRHQHSHSHTHASHRQPQHAQLAVTARAAEHSTRYMHHEAPQHYCEHHAPVSYQPVQVADAAAVYSQLVYAPPRSPAAYHPSVHAVYQPPPPTHYQLVYEAPPTAAHYPATACSHMDASQYYASALLSVGTPQPSLSPPHKPQPVRPAPAALPSLALSAPGSGSAFTPVQPIAVYPRTGILIR